MGLFRNSRTISSADTVLSYDKSVLCNTQSGVFDLELPHITTGNILPGFSITITDAASTFSTNNLTVKTTTGDGSTILGSTSLIMSVDGQSFVFELLENNTWQVSVDKGYVDAAVSGAGYLPLTGGTMAGNIIQPLAPTLATHLSNKEYIDSKINGLDWQESILAEIDFTTAEPAGPSTGDRYINTVTGLGSISVAVTFTQYYIYEWDGTAWDEIIPNDGYATKNEATGEMRTFNGSLWVNFGSTTNHNALTSLQGGAVNEYYHLTAAQHTRTTQAATGLLDGYLSSADWAVFDAKLPSTGGTLTGDTVFQGDIIFDTLAGSKREIRSNNATPSSRYSIFFEDGGAGADWISIEQGTASVDSGRVQVGDFGIDLLSGGTGVSYTQLSLSNNNVTISSDAGGANMTIRDSVDFFLGSPSSVYSAKIKAGSGYATQRNFTLPNKNGIFAMTDDALYGGSGTVPASTTVTITDTLTFGLSSLFINEGNGRVGVNTSGPQGKFAVENTTEIYGGYFNTSGAVADTTSYGARFNNSRTGITSSQFGISSRVQNAAGSGSTWGLVSVTGSSFTNAPSGGGDIALSAQVQGSTKTHSRSIFAYNNATGNSTKYGIEIELLGTQPSGNIFGTYTKLTAVATAGSSFGNYVSHQGASAINYGSFISVSGAGNSNTGLYINVTNGVTSNYALLTGSGQVGFGTSTPNASALVDITSTTQGFLPPRMSTTQKNAISTPSIGLQVYDSTSNELNYYNGSAWVGLNAGGGGAVTGTGTANYVSKWSASGVQTDSLIQDDGSTIGLGSAPQAFAKTYSLTNKDYAMYISNISITGDSYSIYGEATGNKAFDNIGIFGRSRLSTTGNYGVVGIGGSLSGLPSLSGGEYVGGFFSANIATGTNIGIISKVDIANTGSNTGLSITVANGAQNYIGTFIDGNQGLGKVLTSDANGNANWQFSYTLRNVSATDTFATANETINCTANTFTVNLPTAALIQGTTYTLVNSGTGTITLTPAIGEFINGSATINLATQYSSRTVQSDGTNWIII
jgi:hypothetical protein